MKKNKKHKTTTVTVTVSEQTDKQHCDNTYHSRDNDTTIFYISDDKCEVLK